MWQKMIDNLKGGIIGFVIGDALGVPVEFQDRELLEQKPLKEMIGYGTHNVPKGCWSDDTSMMIATIDSINECNEINYDNIMHKFMEWRFLSKYTATDNLFDIGIATNKAILNYKNGISPFDCGLKGVRENGNGSLMRILPFVYYVYFLDCSLDEQIDIINKASSLTHAHEISLLGCNIFTNYVISLLNGFDKKEALENLKQIPYHNYFSKDSIDEYQRILKDNLEDLEKQQIKSSGYIVSTLEAAIWSTIKNDNYTTAVLQSINLGGDTDTIGAITGAINGIIYGKNNIPYTWENEIIRRDYINEITDNFIKVLNIKTHIHK